VSQPLPAYTEGTLSFTNTIIRRENGASAPNLSASTETDSWSQLSFMVQTQGVVRMLFFATGNIRVNNAGNPTSWGGQDNWIQFFTNAEGAIMINHGQTHGAPINNTFAPIAIASNVTYTPGEWMRVDLLYRKLSDNLAEIRLFINGEWAQMEATETTHEWLVVNNGNLDANIAPPNYADRAVVWAGAQTISFRRVTE
jgi:hypothetical protein